MKEEDFKRASEYPLNKPWGFDINPNLWYLIFEEQAGEKKGQCGLLVSVLRKKDGSESTTFTPCFGNMETAIVYTMTAKDLCDDSSKNYIPISGADLQNLYLQLHMEGL